MLKREEKEERYNNNRSSFATREIALKNLGEEETRPRASGKQQEEDESFKRDSLRVLIFGRRERSECIIRGHEGMNTERRNKDDVQKENETQQKGRGRK
jgi:hypothetical protein